MNPKLKEMQLKLKRLLNDVNETLNSIAKLVGEETDLQRWSKRPKIRCIQQTVAEFFNVEASVMQSKLRTQAFVWPRFAAMLLSREMTKYGTAEIAEEFGKRDHSGIIYGSKEAVSRELTDKEFSRQMIKLRQIVRHNLDNLDLPLFATPPPEGNAPKIEAKRTYPKTATPPASVTAPAAAT